MEIRREILIEVGQVEMFDLLLLAPITNLQWYGRALLNDLISSLSVQTPATGSQLTIARATPPPQSLDMQSLLKLGNLFCYADILKANASKESIRQLLTTKIAPGTKTCCWDTTGQSEWSATLKKVFGSDPSMWKTEELVLMGDLLVALSAEDIARINVTELARVVNPLLEGSGLNFPMWVPGMVEPWPFARACVNFLQDFQEYKNSYKALMRKYVLGAELMVTSIAHAQKILNARRIAREAPQWDQRSSQEQHRFRRETPQQQHWEMRHNQDPRRYRRQAPEMMPQRMMGPPPLVQVNRAPLHGQQMRPVGMNPMVQPQTGTGTQRIPPPLMIPQNFRPALQVPQQVNPRLQLLIGFDRPQAHPPLGPYP